MEGKKAIIPQGSPKNSVERGFRAPLPIRRAKDGVVSTLEHQEVEEEQEASYPDFVVRNLFDTNPMAAYSLLFRKYYTGLCNHAVKFLYSKTEAEDLVSDLFIKMLENKSFDRITTSYEAYLYRAVRNRCIDFLRTGLQLPVMEVYPAPEIDDEPEVILLQDEMIQLLNEAIDGLPPVCKQVFLLHRYEGKAQREIARDMGISLRTVEVHNYNALKSLRQAIAARLRKNT